MQLIELCYDNFSSVNLDCSRPVEPSTFDFNENFDFTTHLSYKRENFFGRSWFFRELDDIFENADAPVGVLVTGDPGSGKSALMSQLICSSFSSSPIYVNIIGYHICVYAENEKRNGARFVRNLVNQIASNIPEYALHISNKVHIQTKLVKHCEQDPTACFLTAVIGPLRELKKKPDNFKYIVIDALDECIEKDGETSAILDILHYIMSYFPPWLKIIMSSRNGTTVTSKVPRAVQRVSLNPDDERNIEDIRSYISQYLRKKFSFINKLYKAISPLEDSINKITNELTNRAEGNFLFVKTILQNNLETDGTFNFNSLPNSLDDMYYQLFQRYFIKKDFDGYEILFEVLLANGSLPKTEFFEILNRENQGREMDDLVERVSGLLHFGQDETVSIYHQSFAEWLTNNNHRVKGFSIQKSRGHKYIANFLVDRQRSNPNVSFTELSRLCMHVLNSGGPSDDHKEYLKLLSVPKIRNEQNGKCILHELVQRENGHRLLEVFLSSITLVDIPDLEGKTPAFYAASEGLVENVKPFLDKGTCANCILNDVSKLDEIKAVIQMKGYEELSTMHIATYNGHTEVVDT
jgi:GTPase SAR1 family protein